MKSPAWIVAAVLLLANFALSQDHPASPEHQTNTVQVGADGKFEAAPDTAFIQFNISAQADTAKAAYDQAAKEAETSRQVLRNNGIDPKSAQVGFYSVTPNYDYRNPKHRVIGYTVTTSVSLKLRDFSKIGPIIQQIADADLTESQSLSYTLENMDEAKSKAVADAYRRARISANALAVASGRTLGELSYASVDVSENIRVFQPARRAMAMGAAAAAPSPTEEFTPQAVTVTAHVNALFALK